MVDLLKRLRRASSAKTVLTIEVPLSLISCLMIVKPYPRAAIKFSRHAFCSNNRNFMRGFSHNQLVKFKPKALFPQSNILFQ